MGAVAGYVDERHVGNELAGATGDIPAVRPLSKADVANNRFEPRRVGVQFG
jgi:hypothetical protein